MFQKFPKWKIWRDRIVIVYLLSIETRHDVRYFGTNIWFDCCSLDVTGSFRLDYPHYSRLTISLVAVSLPLAFLYHPPFYVDRAHKGLYSTPKPPPITFPIILFLFDIDWYPASTILPAHVSQKFGTNRIRNFHCLLAFICYPWDD